MNIIKRIDRLSTEDLRELQEAILIEVRRRKEAAAGPPGPLGAALRRQKALAAETARQDPGNERQTIPMPKPGAVPPPRRAA